MGKCFKIRNKIDRSLLITFSKMKNQDHANFVSYESTFLGLQKAKAAEQTEELIPIWKNIKTVLVW